MTADGGATGLSWIDRDPIDPAIALMRVLVRVPAAVRRGLASAVGLTGERTIARFLSAAGEKSVAELWALTARLRAVRMEILARMAAERVDVILGLSRDFVLAGTPSMLWNLTQFPAGVVPVTRVRADETTRGQPRDRLEKNAAAVDLQSAGLPVGVQVVARPWEEGRVLAAMIAIEEVCSAAPGFPRTPVGA
jgi:fatty acid amide hydrolase